MPLLEKFSRRQHFPAESGIGGKVAYISRDEYRVGRVGRFKENTIRWVGKIMGKLRGHNLFGGKANEVEHRLPIHLIDPQLFSGQYIFIFG